MRNEITNHLDITKLKRGHEERAKAAEMMEAMMDGVCVIDVDAKIIDVNSAFERITGYTRDELIGEVPLKLHTERERETVLAGIRECMERGFVRDFETVFLRRDKEEIPILLNGTLAKDAEGKPKWMIATFRDITERKRAEEARVEYAAALARAEELQRSRQRIVAMQESLRRDIAQQLHGSVQNRLIVLLHRLTELERTSSPGQLAGELRELRQELAELLESDIRPISHRLYPAILRRGLVPALQSLADQFEATVAIEMELDEDLMQQERADRKLLLEQVRLAAYHIAEEALTNVVKYAKASRVTVGLELSSEGWLRLTVRDNGQGFDVGSACAGLGMLMMQDYAGVVGGECVIRSAPGEGTEVAATLPVAGPAAQHPRRASPLA